VSLRAPRERRLLESLEQFGQDGQDVVGQVLAGG
jgi:hypothetical protein